MASPIALPLSAPSTAFDATGGSRVARTVLPSGVRVLTEAVPGARSATVGFWVAVGSRDETGPVASTGTELAASGASFGSTHFLEHLLFKGTATRSALDIAVSFDSVGGETNAATGKEHTCYYAKVQDADVPMAVAVLADMVTGSLLDPAEFETERGVILEELAMAEDDPADVVDERFFEAVFGEHPLGRPIGGDPATIRSATRDAVLAHYRATYRPEELVVTVAGAVDHDAVVAGVARALAAAGWDDGEREPVARRASGEATLTRGAAVRCVTRPGEQVNLVAGVPGLVATDRRRTALAVLNAVLGGGMSSRLFQEVRERRGLAYSVYSFVASYSDGGVLGLYAGCSPARSAETAELLLAELRGIGADGIRADELERARGQLAGGSALALEDSDTRMTRLGRAEITLGEFADLDVTLERLAAVTLDDVRDLAAELTSRQVSLAVVGDVDPDRFAGLV